MDTSAPGEALDGLIEHLLSHSIRTDGGPFLLRSGASSSWYIDARQTTFSGSGARLVGLAVLEAIPDELDAVGGMTLGADPIALATAIAADRTGRRLQAFSIRKAVKDHGTGGRLVGPVSSGDRVWILEDTTTTGGALLEAVDVATDQGLDVRGALALVDRSEGRVAALLADRRLPYTALVTPNRLGMQ